MAMMHFFSKTNTQRPRDSRRGFALLVAVIFMSVMLTFGLALGSLAYKQQVLASSAVESQYAFYAADAGLECALYADQQLGTFIYPDTRPSAAPQITCDGSTADASIVSDPPGTSSGSWVVSEQLKLDNDTRCANVKVYKPKSTGTTYIFSQGYDVSCAVVNSGKSSRAVVRGLEAKY